MIRAVSVFLVSFVILCCYSVRALKSGPEEIDKAGHHGDSSSRYSAASSGLSSAAAAAAAAIYPGGMNYYSGGSSSAASNYYPNLAPSPYRYQQHNTGIGMAEPYERTARDYTSTNQNSAGFIDLIPAAGSDSGHGHGGGHGHTQQSHGHGGGWGWGWGHGGGGHYTKVSNTGFGLLGLLGLLSLLQSVLNAMTTTTMAGRKRRSVSDEIEDNQSEDDQHVQRITQLVLPNLNLIAHASNGNVPLECTHRETCLVNAIFLKELGPHGYLVGHRMSTGIANLLKRADVSGHLHKHIEMAGQNGRKGLNCHELYPICRKLLQSNGTIAYPTSLLG